MADVTAIHRETEQCFGGEDDGRNHKWHLTSGFAAGKAEGDDEQDSDDAE
jgi:hypothetical protein